MPRAFWGNRHADKAAGFRGEEVDNRRGDLLRGNDQVAFVFPILVVHQNDHAASADVVKQCWDVAKHGGNQSSTSDQFDRHCGGFAAADAQGRDASFLTVMFQRMDQRHDNPRAGGADRVTLGTRTAMHVHAGGI